MPGVALRGGALRAAGARAPVAACLDPQLHTHCVIFNAARTHEDGKWRALHQHPVYGWVKAAGSAYRNTLAWNLQQDLGIPMKQYGRDGEFTRIVGVPEDLAAHWSKRRAAIVDAANDMGFRVEGNAARAAAANKITRAGKSPDNDPEVRHGRWRGEAEGFCERKALIVELLGKAEDITQEQIRELTAALETLPERLTREEAVFRLPDVVERVSNATAGLLRREAVATSIERVMRHPEVVRLTRTPRSAEGRADMAHTRLYTTGRTLEMEQALREIAAGMAADTGHGLPTQAIEAKLASLLEQGYPLSGEQAQAIRAVAGAQGRVAIVEGAAGSGNIRLDHGYALTIAAAQGLTVDKTFLLVDNRPARETFYPAATRHREEIDVYVNRAPLALDVADRRADNDREAPVLDGEIRAYLAERWSRSVPKEAALDYMAVGDWEDRREDIRERRRTAGNLHHDERAETRTSAANDNALVRIARDVQRTAFAWRHGAAIDAFAAGRADVLASWDTLRERTRAEGDAVALGDTYRETLDRHAALLKQAEPFRARREAFAALLAERGRIGRSDLDDFERLHDRAHRHRRAATMRHVHRTKQEAEQHEIRPEARYAGPQQQEVEARQGELVLEGGRGEAPAKVRTLAPDTAAAPAPDRGETPVESAAAPPPPQPEPSKPGWRVAWDPVVGEWNALVERARQSGALAFYTSGYAGLIPRIRALVENPDIPSEWRKSLTPTLQYHELHLAVRERVEGFHAAADRHMERRHALQDAAADANVAIVEAPKYRRWRREADRLVGEGNDILSDRETHGPHLDNIVIGEVRARALVFDVGEAIREDDEELAQARREAREQRQLARRASGSLMFATDPDLDAAESDPAREALARAVLSRLGHVAGRLVGGTDYEDRMRTEVYRREALERSKQAMRKWNRQVERAVKEGVHVIYTDGYGRLREELESVSYNFLLDSRIAAQICAVLSELGEAKVNAGYVKTRHKFIMHSLERREALEASAAKRGVAVPDLADYDRWRNSADEAVSRGEDILENREDYGLHLHSAARGKESLASALSRVREMLAEDDRHVAETLVGRRQGESVWEREEHIARLLDDPDELRKLRHQRAERRRAGQRQRKGRHQSRGITM